MDIVEENTGAVRTVGAKFTGHGTSNIFEEERRHSHSLLFFTAMCCPWRHYYHDP